ncbi:hypothetical protein SETIT_8G090100v2 [Setaria italica]|uniref:NB-ARC domain-containing protein n=1 Tax=Setaria italica TaxID=4555 RepID=K3ZGY0_SETIT|nr:putative disease resistance RPP13-like protein 2 [Setaria italica]RCV37789.1 hypothetical protein SETIT_8G090100v2 [Setaria italica]
MADLAVGLAKTVLERALTRAQSAIEEESKLRQSTQRDLVFIAGEFEMMHSFLEVANAERVRNNVVRIWVRQVRDLAYDVEDCIEFVIHLDGGNTWWRRVLPSWFCFCIAAAAAPPPLDVAVAEIEQLKARVEDVSRRNSRYSLISDSGSNPGDSASSAAVTATAVDMPGEARNTVKKQPGFSDLTQLIAKDGKELGVMSVWGRSDDLGAMSVIRKAYEDPEVRKTFGCRGWVKLEYPFNRRKFLQSVVAQFYTNSCLEEEKSVDVVELERMENAVVKQGGFVQEFKAQVNEKRYLLVLENVCTMGDWDAIRACLPKSVNGNRIIVSTEEREIARLCIGHSYRVLELKQYSAEYPVCVFFKQGSQGEIDRAMSSEVIHDVNHKVLRRIHTTKMEEVRTWNKNFTLVGREVQMEDLRNYQTKARFGNWRVMSVWGIAGVGKSALVKNFYYAKMVECLFDKYSWVNVEHPLNLMDFSRDLLRDFHSESLEDMEIKDPIQQCRNLLKEYRCLLVINDLQSTEEWDSIQNSLVSRHSQSFIIVITTQENIATYCADNEEAVYNVKGLEAEAAFHLFQQKVLQKKNSSPLKQSKYEDLKQLILKCGGLPKVIVAVADFLAPKTVTCMKDTRTMDEKFMHELESNPEFGCLRGLFDWMHLFFRSCPDFLRPCIFYLSIFPGYQIIRRRRLVMRWVAEGYSRDTKDKTAEERGEVLFSMLVNLCMIQPPQCTVMTQMRMVQCQVSAFFHEYVISRPEEENIVFALEVFELKGQCRPSTQRTGRHLVIQSCWDRDRIVFDSIDFSRLRSLTVFGKWESFFVSENMKVLRVLDLEDASNVTDKDLEEIVKQLPRLKFLSLRGRCEITRLPHSLGDLRQLETLDVRGTSIVTLPASITKLKKLQYVRAGATSLADEQPKSCASASWLPLLCRTRQLVGVEVPAGIDKLTALHTLGVVNAATTPRKATIKELKMLTQLRKLGVSGINKKNCKQVSEAFSCHVHLESLSLWLRKGDQCCLQDISSPPKNLQTLKMYGLVKVVPPWIKDLHKLTKLELEMTISQEGKIIEILGEIKELTILRLRVKPLQDGDGKLDFCVWLNGAQNICYEKVKILDVACTSKLTVVFGSQSMQKLELLTVRCGSASAFKFFELKCLSKLKEVRLIGSQDGILKNDLETQLNEHPGRPALKLDGSSSS